MLQAEGVRDAAFRCDWVGTPIPFQRCLMFIIATANKELQLTAGKICPAVKCDHAKCMCVCVYVCMYAYLYVCIYMSLCVGVYFCMYVCVCVYVWT